MSEAPKNKMSEEELRLHRCCFTGHRPEKLNQTETEIITGLEAAIRKAIDDGYTTFITGMARGVDIWAAEVVLKLKSENPTLHLICAVPFPGFEKSWDDEWRRRYQTVLDSADLVTNISERYYGPGVFMERNKWMVDHSNGVIAVYNGTAGGTRNTIEYARKCARQVEEIKLRTRKK